VKKKGFSLIELIVVLLIISLSISLVTPSLSRFSRTIELKAAAKKVSGILRYYRSEAVNKGQVYQVLFDSDLREVRVQSMELTEEKAGAEKKEGESPQKIYFLPEGVHIKEIKVESPQYSSDLPTIEFYPNGGSNGGTIFLDSEDRKGYRIKIHFLTGMVEVESV
jgi:general secretion pathway protein H